jgi:hypothetical protein
MKLPIVSLLATATAVSASSELISCLINNEPSDYASCCSNVFDTDASSPICTYLQCEMGERSDCSCSTLTDFCHALESESSDIVIPEICAPSIECCDGVRSDEEFQVCVAEKAEEIASTSFLELNQHLKAEEPESEPVVVAVNEDTSDANG